VRAAAKGLAALPRDEDSARELWTRLKLANEERARPLAGMPPHARPFAGDPEGSPAERLQFDDSRRNFLALVFCLMVGTAALPHILMRYYTTPSVKEARQSVTWSLFFIFLLYFTAPALAVLVKFEVLNVLVGTPFNNLPEWIAAWNRVDCARYVVTDVNKDGIFQLGEMKIGGDIIVLATPEIGGLPYVISGLVAAGGLAAALSTADGLLLTITSALSHDVYYRIVRPDASTQLRLVISKSLLLVVAVLAATVAAQKPGTILSMVAWAFSIAGSAFFPALVLGIFWSRATRAGALAGMLVGVLLTLYYILRLEFNSIPWLGLSGFNMAPWFQVQSTSAGVFGVVAGFATIVVVSLLTRPDRGAADFLARIRRVPMREDGHG